MSALLKPGATGAVRPLASAAPFAAVVAPDPRDLECAELRAQLASLRDRLAEVEAAAADAVRAAGEEGHRRGLAEAETREAERVSMLRDGVDMAVTDWRARLESWDGLAATLAGATLARIFEPSADLQELVTRMLARQLREIRRSSLVAIHVSRSDYADEDALAALGRRLASETPLVIEADPELVAGTCRVTCKLEQIDLDVRAQWSALVQLLGEIAAEGSPS
jgi:flagellar biosynthesis/type III secretory pathway protein FliH